MIIKLTHTNLNLEKDNIRLKNWLSSSQSNDITLEIVKGKIEIDKDSQHLGSPIIDGLLFSIASSSLYELIVKPSLITLFDSLLSYLYTLRFGETQLLCEFDNEKKIVLDYTELQKKGYSKILKEIYGLDGISFISIEVAMNCKELLHFNKIENVLNILLDLSKQVSQIYHNELILISSSYNRVSKNVSLGLISYDEYQLCINRIVQSLIILIDDITIY